MFDDDEVPDFLKPRDDAEDDGTLDLGDSKRARDAAIKAKEERERGFSLFTSV